MKQLKTAAYLRMASEVPPPAENSLPAEGQFGYVPPHIRQWYGKSPTSYDALSLLHEQDMPEFLIQHLNPKVIQFAVQQAADMSLEWLENETTKAPGYSDEGEPQEPMAIDEAAYGNLAPEADKFILKMIKDILEQKATELQQSISQNYMQHFAPRGPNPTNGIPSPYMIRDAVKRVSQRLYRWISGEAKDIVGEKYRQKHANDLFMVRTYGVSGAYGGAEEGGWYYDDLVLTQEKKVKGLQTALDLAEKMRDTLQHAGEDTFYDDLLKGHGGTREATDADDPINDADFGAPNVQEGEVMNPGWRPTGHDHYVVKVELPDSTDRSTNGFIPHYQ